jgi:hypothetical protein
MEVYVYVEWKWKCKWKFVGSTINMTEDEIKLRDSAAPATRYFYFCIESSRCGASLESRAFQPMRLPSEYL